MSKVLRTYSTISLPEATFYEIQGIPVNIEIQRNKAIFTFKITQDLVNAKEDFNALTTQVQLQNFLNAMNSLKRRMFATLIEKGEK